MSYLKDAPWNNPFIRGMLDGIQIMTFVLVCYLVFS